ncbi:hypothetical protein [Candidatus Solirubrobacter pratensis]|uniref:hypothetical protein n=1 Tax=Candidatus Solirubrobacter pratensis TaxID=1298857 RepID=UPI00055CC5C3|nr:hypothetical protein [Candidatus Solirubrobacter pratensis]
MGRILRAWRELWNARGEIPISIVIVMVPAYLVALWAPLPEAVSSIITGISLAAMVSAIGYATGRRDGMQAGAEMTLERVAKVQETAHLEGFTRWAEHKLSRDEEMSDEERSSLQREFQAAQTRLQELRQEVEYREVSAS